MSPDDEGFPPGDGPDSDRDGAGLRRRIVDQFSYRGPGGAIWRGFDEFLDTEAYLNLGYSGRFESHLIGSPQRRLAERVGATLAAVLPRTAGVRLLDLGCGRGGPATVLAGEHGFDVVGVDLVPFNVATARSNASGASTEFLVGDATALPIADGSVGACTAVDTLVYVPDERSAFRECARVLEPGGVLVATDLVAETSADERALRRFSEAWDMPHPPTLEETLTAIEDAGMTVESIEDVSPHSVDRFRKWTRLYLALAGSPASPALRGLLRRFDLDPPAITERVRAAHAALPSLRHVAVLARRPDES